MTTLKEIRERWSPRERGDKEWADNVHARMQCASADIHYLLSMLDDYEKLAAFAEELLDRSQPDPGCDELESQYNSLRNKIEESP